MEIKGCRVGGLLTYDNDELTEKIIQCIIKVHKELGPGFLEKVYRRSLLVELKFAGLNVETEKEITILYRNTKVGEHRLDLIVNGIVVIELKTVESLSKAHYAQIRSYLKATHLKKGLLVNFASERADFRRIEL